MKTSRKMITVLIVLILIILVMILISQQRGFKSLAFSPFRLFSEQTTNLSLEPTPTGRILPTSLPYQGISVSVPTELQISQDDKFELKRLFSPDLNGTRMVAQAEVDDGIAIVLIDLETNQTHLLSTPRELQGAAPSISDESVVWAEPVDIAQSLFQLQVYDLQTSNLTTPYVPDYYHHLDFADNVAVWEGYLNETQGIYGYNIKTVQGITIAQTLVGCPRISYPWVIYLDYNTDTLGQRRLDQVAKLWAYHLETQEKLFIGLTFNPNDSTVCSYHAIDTHWIAWFGTNSESSQNADTYAPFVYDLNARSVYIPNIPIQWPPRVLLSENTAIFGNIGLDLVNHKSFNVIPIPEVTDMTGIPLLLSQERLVWLWNAGIGTQRIYQSRIVQQ